MSDIAYRIVGDTGVNANVVAAVQAVPLVWTPYVGVDAWGAGDPVRTSAPGVRPPTFSATQVYWGVVGDQFFVGSPPPGVNNPPSGSTWNETQAVAALTAIAGVTVTEE